MKPKIGVIGSAGSATDEALAKAEELGREIARQGAVVLTGACTGVPYAAMKGAKAEGGMAIGVSPAENLEEHKEKYSFPTEGFDAIIFTGFGYKGRNVVLVRSCDAVVAVAGREGTLNEFTIAFGGGMPLGVLKGTGGIADAHDTVLKLCDKPEKENVVCAENPKELVEGLLKRIK